MKTVLPMVTKKNVSEASSQAQELPRISRMIPELLKGTIGNSVFWVNGVCLGLLLAITYVLFQDYQTYQHIKQVKDAREQIVAEMHYWETVVKKYPNYRDGYLMLASINEQLGDITKAREYNGKALQLDPDFQAGRDFEKTLN